MGGIGTAIEIKFVRVDADGGACDECGDRCFLEQWELMSVMTYLGGSDAESFGIVICGACRYKLESEG